MSTGDQLPKAARLHVAMVLRDAAAATGTALPPEPATRTQALTALGALRHQAVHGAVADPARCAALTRRAVACELAAEALRRGAGGHAIAETELLRAAVLASRRAA